MQAPKAREAIPYIVSSASGFVVCLAISTITGKREAWDSGLYFTLGIPVMVVIISVRAYKFPQRAWRWSLAMAAGQILANGLQY